jgi:uroporphyrinogen decarboxylase
MCRKHGVLYLFHSNGQKKDLIGDIVDWGFIGLHPIGPKPMDAIEVKAKWGQRVWLLGHVDVDLLARGTPQQTREQNVTSTHLPATVNIALVLGTPFRTMCHSATS